jgi:quercetin dioxygenase-like cupin family protein
MSVLNLNEIANALTVSWQSQLLANIGTARVKVLRMDGSAYSAESHDYVEALIVLEGQMNLIVNNEMVVVNAGSAYMMPAGISHAVASDSHGTLIIVDV